MIDNWPAGLEIASGNEDANQHLCFWLGSQIYALPVGEVQEIRAVGGWSALPGTPKWVLGAMNLRGLVIPLLDLRTRFAIEPAAQIAAAVLIVISAGKKLAGLAVDGVMDVTSLSQPAPRQGGAADRDGEARCVAGVAALGESVVIVLDAKALMGWEADSGGSAAHDRGEDGPGQPEPEGVEHVAMVR
jgi:purine-binding chemotaxis protein CheW